MTVGYNDDITDLLATTTTHNMLWSRGFSVLFEELALLLLLVDN